MPSNPKPARIFYKPPQTKAILATVALSLVRSITLRAFPDDGYASISVDHVRAKPLSEDYRWRKTLGLVVTKVGSAKRKVGARKGVADSRLTSLTAKALGIVSMSNTKAIVGFGDARAKKVATYLQQRNNFFPQTTTEEQLALDRADVLLQQSVAKAAISPGVINMRLRIGGR